MDPLFSGYKPMVKLLIAIARKNRPAAFVDWIMELGKHDGKVLAIERELYEKALQEFKLTRPGLGDQVATVAQPIARVVDRIIGTKLRKCGGCASRQDRLNAALPPKEETEPDV